MVNRIRHWSSTWFFFKLAVIEIRKSLAWVRRNFRSPAPHFVKMQVLKIAQDCDVWIETGTYLGQTSRFLSKLGGEVKTIEPSDELVQDAKKRFRNLKNLEIVHGLSEENLEAVILKVQDADRKSIAFWLDGHYSAGITFRGPKETPIERELEIISRYLKLFAEIWIFIDDFRCFVGKENDYPSPSVLVQWAASNNLRWGVEQDIFIATTSKVPW